MKYSALANKFFRAKICKSLFYIITISSFLLPDFLFSIEALEADDIYDYDFSQLAKLKISSATKTPQTITEVPSTVYIITSLEIKEKGYFTLDDVLSDLPGFQFRNMLSFNSYSFLRGVPNQNNLILVLIDGVQINELNSGGFYGGGQYNLSNIERIEVLYGPSSVVYGTNAVSGIINIITKKATQKQIEMNALIGGFNTASADFTISGGEEKENSNSKKFGIRFSGMFRKSNKADLRGLAGDNNWTDLLNNFENNYAFDFKLQAGNFTLGSNYQQKESSSATYMKSVGTIYKDYGTLWNINFFNNYLRYENKFSRELSFASMLYNRNATVLDNSVLYVVDTAQFGYYRPNNLFGFENIVNYHPFDILTLTASLTLEYERLAENYSITKSSSADKKPPTPEAPPMKNNFLASIFLETLVNPIENLAISAGARFDNSSVYHQVFTPQLGLSYNFHNQIIKLLYAEAFRAPKPWDYTDGLGNNDLLPERMKSLEMGLILNLDNHHIIDLVAYKNSFENAITKEFIGESYRWVNEGVIKTTGFEIYYRYLSSSLKYSLNYTFTESENSKGEFIPEISKHTASASVSYYPFEFLSFNLRANYIGERENPKIITATNSKTIEPCLILNGSIILWSDYNFNFQFTVKNLLDTEYYHPSNRPPDRYRQPQRTLLFSVSYSIIDDL